MYDGFLIHYASIFWERITAYTPKAEQAITSNRAFPLEILVLAVLFWPTPCSSQCV